MHKENNHIPSVFLENDQIIGYGATSTVYLLPDKTICKVFQPEFSIHDIQREYHTAESAYHLGIRVPKPSGIVQAKDRIGILSEFIDGECLSELLSNNPENYCTLFPEYLRNLCRCR